jgi:hypothetical protein
VYSQGALSRAHPIQFAHSNSTTITQRFPEERKRIKSPMIANFNHNHQKIFGASWKAVVLAFPIIWGENVGRGDTTEHRTYPCTQVQLSWT